MAEQSLRERSRRLARDIVLDAAERLLQKSETADFSMRALAAEAGVGFATPFNHFGSKNAIMQALSSRLIERMATRFGDQAPGGDAIDRVLTMGQISIALLLEKPDVHKAVIGSLGIANSTPSIVRRNSTALWSLALDEFIGLAASRRPVAQVVLSEQLAFNFRGCVSFWIAGELADEKLGAAFRTGICALLLGFAKEKRRAYLIEQIESLQIASELG